jgi:hypothetical protein
MRPETAQTRAARHEVQTVQDMGWAGIKNGALLKLANGQFDALLTVDQGGKAGAFFGCFTMKATVERIPNGGGA